jgi:hypothetical protein
LKLTASRFIILAKMVQHPRRHFSAEQILDWINPDGIATDQSPIVIVTGSDGFLKALHRERSSSGRTLLTVIV